MDITTIIGLLAGLAAMVGGFLWEGGSLSGLLQPNAALIVFGGTRGRAGQLPGLPAPQHSGGAEARFWPPS